MTRTSARMREHTSSMRPASVRKVYVLLEDNYYNPTGPAYFLGVFATREEAVTSAAEYSSAGEQYSVARITAPGECARVFVNRHYEPSEEPEATEYEIAVCSF